VSFYPSDGGVNFAVSKDNVSVGEKTSITGPGFHAALIDLCDHIARDIGLDWNWEAGGDETNFALTRDRESLERSFVDQFSAFCEHYRRADPTLAYKLNLEIGMAISVNDVATPLGVKPLEFFRSAPDDDHDRLASMAQELFPWWRDTLDAAFWANLVRTAIWTTVEWRSPAGSYRQWEEHVHGAVLQAAQRARDLGVQFDADIEAALRELAHFSPEMPQPPAGVGYRRLARSFEIGGPWEITLPGYYVRSDEGDGTLCLWFGDEEVRASSFSYTPATPGELVWTSSSASYAERAMKLCKARVQTEPKRLQEGDGWIAFAECSTLDAEGRGHLLVLSLTHATPQISERLSELAGSVFFNPPQPLPSKPHDA
jgi:hypothetical protein